MKRIRCYLFSGILVSVAALSPRAARPNNLSDDVLHPAFSSINADDLLTHIRTLASDEFEGRAPATAGEEKTVNYLIEQFRRLGLEPGNPDGTYVQEVPLVGIRTVASGTIEVRGKSITLKAPDDWVAVSRRLVPESSVENSPLVFVGYGVVAPEFGWDDYKGLDVRGKTLVMLVNDPPVPDPADPDSLDEAKFGGRAMTYYGRWTYKYEIAAKKGAAAVLLVHETGPAGYPFEVVSGSWGRENFELSEPNANRGRVAVEAWICRETAGELCTACGQDFEKLKAAAARAEFSPVPLGATADFIVKNTLREVRSRNVVARLAGSDPNVRDESVIYTAHWDHLGRDVTLTGDQIYNGAADNASGVAALLEIAEGFTRLTEPPRRSILFLALTAEEQGLLGARYYASHPLYPLSQTLADINMDVINLWGRTEDVVDIGLGLSTLDEVLAAAAQSQGRSVLGDPDPEKGHYYRSDHFEFAKRGVPAINAKAGTRYIDRPDDYAARTREAYTRLDYHKVSDEVKPDWDLSGAVEDCRLLLAVGYQLAQGDAFPTWKPGAEFRAVGEARLHSNTRDNVQSASEKD